MPGGISIRLPALAGEQLHFTGEAMKIIDSLAGEKRLELTEKYRGECRLLMHELFTNAVNHSSSSEVEFSFTLNADHILIEMVTEGPGFRIKPVNPDSTPGNKVFEPPFSGLINRTFILHLDSEFEVVCRVESENTLSLFSRTRDIPDVNKNSSIPEHFGLFIITRLGTGVRYRKENDGRNIFSLKRLLPGNHAAPNHFRDP